MAMCGFFISVELQPCDLNGGSITHTQTQTQNQCWESNLNQ